MGGLWYAVASVKDVDAHARAVVLGFSAIAALVLIFMVNRVRNVFGEYLLKVEAFNPIAFADSKHEHIWFALLKERAVVLGFSILMGIAGLMSAVAACMIWAGALTFNP